MRCNNPLHCERGLRQLLQHRGSAAPHITARSGGPHCLLVSLGTGMPAAWAVIGSQEAREAAAAAATRHMRSDGIGWRAALRVACTAMQVLSHVPFNHRDRIAGQLIEKNYLGRLLDLFKVCMCIRCAALVLSMVSEAWWGGVGCVQERNGQHRRRPCAHVCPHASTCAHAESAHAGSALPSACLPESAPQPGTTQHAPLLATLPHNALPPPTHPPAHALHHLAMRGPGRRRGAGPDVLCGAQRHHAERQHGAGGDAQGGARDGRAGGAGVRPRPQGACCAWGGWGACVFVRARGVDGWWVHDDAWGWGGHKHASRQAWDVRCRRLHGAAA